jgi:hypothetical protein
MDLTTGVVGLSILCGLLAAQDEAHRSWRERRRLDETIGRRIGGQRQ